MLGLKSQSSRSAAKANNAGANRNVGSVFFDEAFYASQLGKDAPVGGDALYRHYQSQGAKNLVAPHPLFDPKFYVRNNQDIGRADPLDHYRQYGWKEGRQPHPLFSPDYYLRRYTDVAEAGMEPLTHYLEYGWKEFRSPHPLFDPQTYFRAHPHLIKGRVDPLRHYIGSAWHEGVAPHALIDDGKLRVELENIAQASIQGSPFKAYLNESRFWGASTHALFDAEYYATGFAGEKPRMPLLVHYLSIGWKEGRQPHPLFSPDYYLCRHTDVAEADMEPLTHFVDCGMSEMRQTHPLLSPAEYAARVAGCEDVHPLVHYLRQNGRVRANAWVDEDMIAEYISEIDGEPFEGCALDSYLRDPRYRMATPNLLFDAKYYLAQRGKPKIEPPLADYLIYGAAEGHGPHPLVDEAWYRDQFPSAEAGAALEQYLRETHAWGYTTHIYFDEKYYKQNNPAVSGPGLLHYIARGEQDSARPNSYFSPLYYRNAVARDLPPGGALRHFAETGDADGLRPSPEFDPVFYRAAYAGALKSEHPLKHYMMVGRYYGFHPLRAKPIGLKASDWLAARDAQATDRTASVASSIAWFALHELRDALSRRLLTEEASAFAGAPAMIDELGVNATASVLLGRLSSLGERTHVAILQGDCLASRHDLHRLALSLDDHADDIVAVPIAAAPSMSLVNPPLALDGSPRSASPDIDHPDFNFRREVDAVGAPAALFRLAPLRTLLTKMRGDEKIDLDKLLAAAGSVASSGVFLASGAAVRMPFAAARALAAAVRPTAQRRNLERRRKVFYVDSTIPRPDLDAGSDTAWRVLQIMNELGFDVTFVPAVVEDSHRKYIEAARRIGVKVVCPPYVRDIVSYIDETDETFDIAFLARAPVVGALFEPVQKKWPKCRIVFNTVDIHYLRLLREAILHQDTDLFSHAMELKSLEIDLIGKADETIVLSEAELDLLREEGVEASVTVVPPVYDAARPYPYDPATRSGVFFIGGYAHAPNIDAVDYFVTEVWPLVTAQRSDIIFHIVGAQAPTHFATYASDTVNVVGFVDDVDDFLSGMRLMVSPLRYGAGIKVKIIASLSAGVPAIVTSPSVEGAGIEAGDGYRVANSKEEIAREIIALYDQFDALSDLSRRGKAAVKARYSVDALRTKYRELLRDAPPRVVTTAPKAKN